MLKKSALFISVLFHPALVNSFTLWLMFGLFPSLSFMVSQKVFWFYFMFIAGTTCLIPMLWVFISSLLSRNASIHLHDKSERNIPLIITASIYLFNFYFFRKLGAPYILNAYLLGASSVVVSLLIVNQFSKISLHAAALGTLLSVVIISNLKYGTGTGFFLPILIGISGMVLSARLVLNAHDTKQIYFGYFLGSVVMWLILY